MALLNPTRQFALMLDYEFGKGVGKSLPKKGLRFYYSRRSGRLKQVAHDGRLFSIIRPNGAIALTVYAATALLSSQSFLENCITVSDEAAAYVKQGRSVFCKFVTRVGNRVLPGSEVAVLDTDGRVIAVGTARVPGASMREFKAGVAVKVRGAAG